MVRPAAAAAHAAADRAVMAEERTGSRVADADVLADAALSAGLAGAAWGVAGVVGALAVLDAVTPAPHRWAMTVGSVVASLGIATIGVLHHRLRFSARVAGHLAGVCALVCALNSVDHVALTLDPLQATYLMLTVIGAGAVLTIGRWLVAVDAVAVVGFAPLAASRLQAEAWRHFAVSLVFSIAVAHVLQYLRARGQGQVQLLTDALADQARRDQLTGLFNRRGLLDALPALVAASSGGPLGVLCLDVDGFKRINDELGHAAGDMVLTEIAERLAGVVGTGDAVVRLGGDEFALLVPGADPDALERLGHRLRIKLSGTAGVLGLPWAVSVGTASGSVGDRHELERLLAAADIAMYDDKQVRRASLGAPAQHRPFPPGDVAAPAPTARLGEG